MSGSNWMSNCDSDFSDEGSMTRSEAKKIVHARRTQSYSHYIFDDQDLKRAREVLK